MQRIGRVLHMSPDGNIVLRAENLPKIGDHVVDKARNPVGKVFDIIGPFKSPYIIVKPYSKDLFSERSLYTVPSVKTKKRKGRKKN